MNATNEVTEAAANIRNRIKAAGIKARVAVSKSGDYVKVLVPTYETEFSADEQRTIRLIASVNELTWVRGLPIDIDQMTNPKEFAFYVSKRAYVVKDGAGVFIASTNREGVAKLHADAHVARHGGRAITFAQVSA